MTLRLAIAVHEHPTFRRGVLLVPVKREPNSVVTGTERSSWFLGTNPTSALPSRIAVALAAEKFNISVQSSRVRELIDVANAFR
jgi:hypothetical protein